MKKTLADLWRVAREPVVEYKGLTVHAALFKHVREPGLLVVRFIKAVPRPVQALRIDIDPGNLSISGTDGPKMILRLDTSLNVVQVHYQPARNGSRITFYNAWISEDGSVDAWLMNYGMLVEESGNKMTLRCSDGRGEPTFDDLIVEIEFLEK